jgi:iron-sulfur cluster repair protein YtfE (RIC family)
MNAIDLLKKDHQKVTELFQRFNGGGGLSGLVNRVTGNVDERTRISAAQQICRELEIHTQIEEAIFYPAIRALGDKQLSDMINEAFNEHAKVKKEVATIQQQLREDQELQDRMSSLQSDVDHHVREEEGEMFPRVAELMPKERLSELGAEMQSMKRRAGGSTERAGRTRVAAGARARTRKVGARGTTVKRTRGRRGTGIAMKSRKRVKAGGRRSRGGRGR